MSINTMAASLTHLGFSSVLLRDRFRVWQSSAVAVFSEVCSGELQCESICNRDKLSNLTFFWGIGVRVPNLIWSEKCGC